MYKVRSDSGNKKEKERKILWYIFKNRETKEISM